MNRIFSEGVSSSVSRVSGLNVSSVSGQCRQSCDLPTKAVPKSANKRPNNDNSIKISFNGIFESKHTSEGSVASDSTYSPEPPPMGALNHTRHSPEAANDHNDMDDHLDESRDALNQSVVHAHRRGRKRKVKEVLDPLKDKLDAMRRIQKSQTTEELAQKFNCEVRVNESSCEVGNNSRIVTTIRTKRNKKVSEVETIDDNTTESKSELMQRFLSSQSSAAPEDNDLHYHSMNAGFGDPQVTSAESEQTLHALQRHPSQQPNTSLSHRKTVSSDSVGEEIADILSHLPPLYVSEIVWSDCEHNCSDNDLNSDDNRDHNHNRDVRISCDIETNNDSNNTNNSFDMNLVNTSNNDNSNTCSKPKPVVSDYEVDKYCDQRWEYVSGTYDAETEWRSWAQMTTALSYNGDVLHILPYVDVSASPDACPDTGPDVDHISD